MKIWVASLSIHKKSDSHRGIARSELGRSRRLFRQRRRHPLHLPQPRNRQPPGAVMLAEPVDGQVVLDPAAVERLVERPGRERGAALVVSQRHFHRLVARLGPLQHLSKRLFVRRVAERLQRRLKFGHVFTSNR